MRHFILIACFSIALAACSQSPSTVRTGTGRNADQQILSAHQEFDRIGFITRTYRRSGMQVIEFDEIAWLTGREAEEAYREDNPDCEAAGSCVPPNDFYVRNVSSRVEKLTVFPGAAVRLVGHDAGGSLTDVDTTFRGLTDTITGTGSQVKESYASIPFWIDEEDDAVVAIKEQYVP